MQTEIVCQGRHLSGEQLNWLRQWVAEHPDWSRQRLARSLCREWNWCNGRGRLKDFAAGSLLEKLADRGWILLPAPRLHARHPRGQPARSLRLELPSEPVQGALSDLLPLQWIVPEPGQPAWHRFDAYLQAHHYLGLRVVGENLKYLIRDCRGRDLGCLLFGAAAWQVSARDQFLGWNPVQRAAGLHYLTNNTRFLILPGTKVAGLAGCLLSQMGGRISQDWQAKYGHPIYLLESFVQRDRFVGACYQATNWLCVGQTQGRGRQGPDRLAPTQPVKDVYLYPVDRQFRQRLLEVT